MTEQEMKARIERSRELIDWSREEYQSDQTLKKPQPPLVKAPMTENTMELPKNFGDLPMLSLCHISQAGSYHSS